MRLIGHKSITARTYLSRTNVRIRPIAASGGSTSRRSNSYSDHLRPNTLFLLPEQSFRSTASQRQSRDHVSGNDLNYSMKTSPSLLTTWAMAVILLGDGCGREYRLVTDLRTVACNALQHPASQGIASAFFHHCLRTIKIPSRLVICCFKAATIDYCSRFLFLPPSPPPFPRRCGTPPGISRLCTASLNPPFFNFTLPYSFNFLRLQQMSFSHAAPPSPTSSASSSGPQTPDSSPTVMYPSHVSLPVLPDLDGRLSHLDNYDDESAGGVKRALKLKQRPDSSAERRASHNAVERARREALNARFLDLAAVLPNLAHVRRPSKSSIVNSSIAHVRASRRHRIIAAQQLRALASECESLRREANEWRARAGVMRLDTPSRGDAFSTVMGEELHYEVGDLQGVYEEGEGDEFIVSSVPGYRMEDEMLRLQMMQAQQHTSPFAYNVPVMPRHPAPLPPSSSGSPGFLDPYALAIQGQQPVIASPTTYDNYDQQLQLQQLMMQQEADEKWAYTQQMMHAQGVLETPLMQDRSPQGTGVW